MELIYGINPLKEALVSGGEGVTRIVVARGRSESAISEIRTMATQQGIPVEVRERAFLDNLAGHASHQGVLGVCKAYRYQDLDAVIANLPEATVVIKAAAVADYRPAVREAQKIKKKNEDLTVKLERNPDIIQEIGQKKEDRILVGFAMESERLVENAISKMVTKNMDFIVANDLTKKGAGFQGDTNIISILDRDGEMKELPLMDKVEAAAIILDKVRAIRDSRRKNPEKGQDTFPFSWKTVGGGNKLQ